MLYVINGTDVPNSLEKRMAVRSEHLRRIQALQEAGRLILAGPYPAIDSPDPGTAGFSGSLIVAEFESLESAQACAAAAPYVPSRSYQDVTVKTIKKVLPP